MERWDAIVVGAGVTGTATARVLARRGRRTLLLERLRIGHDRGSSHGPTRIFRLAYHHPDYVRMARAALEGWRELEAEGGEPLLITTGGLDVGPGADIAADSLAAAGEPFEWLAAEEAGERWPAMRFEAWPRVLHQRDAGVCLASRAVRAQAESARRAGATVLEETSALELRPVRDGVEVRTEEGMHRTPVAVMTAGAWARDLLEPAGIDLPVTVTQEQVSYFSLPERGSLPTLIEWAERPRYAVPDPTEPGHVKVGEHGAGPVVDPDRRSFRPDPEGVRRVAAWAAERFVEPAPERTETCLYTSTADEDFVIERMGPLVVGSACSGHGFKFGPLIGRALADLACGDRPPLPLERFALGRPAIAPAGS